MKDVTEEAQPSKAGKPGPVRHGLAAALIFAWVFAVGHIGSWLECRELFGMSVPRTASLSAPLSLAGILVITLIYRMADHWRNPTRREEILRVALLVLIVVGVWHLSVNEYESTLGTLERGGCEAVPIDASSAEPDT